MRMLVRQERRQERRQETDLRERLSGWWWPWPGTLRLASSMQPPSWPQAETLVTVMSPAPLTL